SGMPIGSRRCDTNSSGFTRIAIVSLCSVRWPAQHTPSDVKIISPFVDQLMRFISRFRAEDGSDFEIELALREALANAIVHGNEEDPNKRVYVNCRCTPDGEVSIRIEDEGNGFVHDAVPDPTSHGNRLRTHGRGIYLIRTLMDDVDFEERGSVVHMR